MERKNIEDMTNKECWERFFELMNEPIPPDEIEGLNEEALKKLTSLVENAKEFEAKNKKVSITRMDTISNKQTCCCVAIEIFMGEKLKTIQFGRDIGYGDTYTPLAKMFDTADWVMFKVVSERRIAIFFYIEEMWVFKDEKGDE